MESAKNVVETKTKSIFELESDEETQNNEGDSGLAASLEASPIQNSKEVDHDIAVDNLSPLKEIASSSEDPDTSKPREDIGDSRPSLSAFQKARIERNRQKALLLRQARLQAHPYNNGNAEEHSVIRIKNSRLIDSGGGFLINEKELEEEQQREVFDPIVITQDPAPIILPDRPHCDECEQPLHDSLLYRSFSHPVCDPCKDAHDEKYSLITRTDARQEYLLKDCDLDLREPILRYILRKNPLNPNWGDMKLYLRLQASLYHPKKRAKYEKIQFNLKKRKIIRKKKKIRCFKDKIKRKRSRERSVILTHPKKTLAPSGFGESFKILFRYDFKRSRCKELFWTFTFRLLLEHERLHLEQVQSKHSSESDHYLSLAVLDWNLAMLKRCNRQGLFTIPADCNRQVDALMAFKKSCCNTLKFSSKNIPVALIQVRK
uniref:EOG090X0KP6 n=1 Tax=Daphnia sinensis TaxID=1820382 RepID=A0A4Y7N7G8_9CRUS|nr:EOG090X0KP6 [Daphnia sinensis]